MPVLGKRRGGNRHPKPANTATWVRRHRLIQRAVLWCWILQWLLGLSEAKVLWLKVLRRLHAKVLG